MKEKYTTHIKPFLKEIREKVEQGIPEKEIYKSLGVSQSSWELYKTQHSELLEVLKKDEEKTRQIIRDLDNALLKLAKGYTYTERKTYISEDSKGNKTKHIEEFEKHQPPQATAIFGALNRYDKKYVKDKALWLQRNKEIELKEKELELKKQVADVGGEIDTELNITIKKKEDDGE